MPFRTQRIRDPIHDLIVFDEQSPLDQVAWELIQTREFQRLRWIKQLGVSEFVYPGATHSRFAHSIGVFRNARKLTGLIKREIDLGRAEGEFDPERAEIAMLAALLHDIGHGPFSHAFEEARKSIAERRASDRTKATITKHEGWTAEIIRSGSGRIREILDRKTGRADAVADLIDADTPRDMYDAIVSSSFDADRLDYLLRDRHATGTKVGGIDLEWLFDNVRVAVLDVSPAGDEGAEAIYRHSFCLGYKAREAAEEFLLARYRLYTNVYLHKTTRGIEQMLSAVIRGVAEAVDRGEHGRLGLADDEPLVRFLTRGGETLANYLPLDDAVAWAAIARIALGADERLAGIARRLRTRGKPLALDVQTRFPDSTERQRRAQHRIEEVFRDQLGVTVFRDDAWLTLYGAVGADDEKAQQRLMIQLSNGELREITELDFGDGPIGWSHRRRRFLRYYFLEQEDRSRASAAIGE